MALKKWAFLGIAPGVGGPSSVFMNLRVGLAQYGIELRRVVVGVQIAGGKGIPIDSPSVEIVAPDETDEISIAKILMNHLLNNYAGVIVNVLGSRLCTNLMRYMPPSYPRLQIVHSISIGTYSAAVSVRDYVHATIGVSPRIAADLIKHYSFDVKTCLNIPNSIRDEFLSVKKGKKGRGKPLEILFLARIEQQSKGVFDLPRLLRHLEGCDVHLTIAGDGPDLGELKRRCQCFGDRVSFLGKVPYEEVPQVMASAEVYVSTSRFEGFGISLVEAMAMGCVPISSRIRGVTDSIVKHGVTGFLFEIGDMKSAAQQIRSLLGDRQRLGMISAMGMAAAHKCYSIDSISRQYAKIISYVEEGQRHLKAPLLIERWRYPKGLKPGLRTFLPENIKAKLRLIREKIT